MTTLLSSLRFVLLFGSAGTALSALVMIWQGGHSLFSALLRVIDPTRSGKPVVTYIMDATDEFLFGIVLIIFAYAITFGFALRPTPAMRERLPSWIHIDDVKELKAIFFDALIVYLAVDFITDITEADGHMTWEMLVKPLSMMLMAGAMRLLVKPHK